jgi:hypothetical protein
MPAQHSTIAIESRADKGKKGLLRGRGDISVDWEPSVLSVAKAVLPESGPEKLQLIIQAFAVIKCSGPEHQRGN